MEISIKWKAVVDGRPVWRDFDVSSIAHYPRSHSLHLFSNPIPVVIKQDAFIISNDMEMRNLYRKKGNRVFDLSELVPESGRLDTVGFV